jgi:hypothetical protein
MKKGIVFLAIVFAGLILLLLIPAKRQHKQTLTIECPPDAVTRFMIASNEWKKWWPGQQINDTTFVFQHTNYTIKHILMNGFFMVSANQRSAIELSFVPALNNHTQFTIICTGLLSYNPFKRIVQLFSREEKQKAINFMEQCQSFFSKTSNVYGYTIERNRVSLLNWMSAKHLFTQYPSTTEMYSVIEGLEKYIQSQNGAILGAPIVHIRTLDTNQFELMTALPVTQAVTPNNQYSIKQMVPGFMLTGQVKGGTYTVTEAEKSMENYVRDYRKQSPAIPFQTLITDRRKETDTSKWVTQLNYPVFN